MDYINRFRTSAQQTQILKDLKEGKIDILIGTHRLVSKDVVWKDLGLMIIDEEQKFGVNVKDKLKTLRATVDTLTLTATPIPRTLVQPHGRARPQQHRGQLRTAFGSERTGFRGQPRRE